LVSLPDSEDRAKAIVDAMDSIEEDYQNLQGVLPKNEYQELDNKGPGSRLVSNISRIGTQILR